MRSLEFPSEQYICAAVGGVMEIMNAEEGIDWEDLEENGLGRADLEYFVLRALLLICALQRAASTPKITQNTSRDPRLIMPPWLIPA